MPGFAQDSDLQKAAAEAAAAIASAGKQEEKVVKPRYWTTVAEFGLGIAQTSHTNWAAGGYNTATLSTSLDTKANYAKDLQSWTNRLQMQYAFLWSADKWDLLQKSADRIYLESRWSYKTSKESAWSYSAALDFRTQFNETRSNYAKGEDGIWTGTLKSDFFSPAYLNLGIGMDWKVSRMLSISMSPVTGSLIFCSVPALRQGYGMKLRDGGTAGVDEDYHAMLFQLGPQIKSDLKFTVNDAFAFETQLVMFSDYFDHPFTHWRVNWDTSMSWQLSRLVKLGFKTWLIYDPVVKITSDRDIDLYPSGKDRIQFKEFLEFTLTYTFKPRRQ